MRPTIVNLLEEELGRAGSGGQQAVVSYQPWSRLSGETLTIDFIQSIAKEVIGLPIGKGFRKVGETMLAFASQYSCISAVRDVASFAKDLIEGKDDMDDLRVAKREVSKALRRHRHPLIIVIDDTDRLGKDEICDLFGLIKNVVDFSNTIFVLAFNYDVVSRALGSVQGVSGEEYLAKIIQILIVISDISQEDLIDSLLEDCRERLGARLDDSGELFSVRTEYLQPFALARVKARVRCWDPSCYLPDARTSVSSDPTGRCAISCGAKGDRLRRNPVLAVSLETGLQKRLPCLRLHRCRFRPPANWHCQNRVSTDFVSSSSISSGGVDGESHRSGRGPVPGVGFLLSVRE